MTKGQPVFGLAFFSALLAAWIPAYATSVPATTGLFSVLPAAAQSPDFQARWIDLNRYEPGRRQGYESQIVNDEFFVSANGRTDPHSELLAFMSIVGAHVESGLESDTLCRFPARLLLFSEYGLLPANFSAPECAQYEEAYRPSQVRSVSLVFASGYYESPASYFGHTLLKFNYGGADGGRDVLDRSINYGADIPGNEVGPLYIARGLLGGYMASYTDNSALIHSYLYTNKQLRDLWEYPLDLTEREIRMLVSHAWEMKAAHFRYFFFNDNCAHRIAMLVEVATGRDLTSSHGFWLLPVQVVRNLDGKDDGSLVKGELHHPSLQSRFNRQYARLDRDARRSFTEFFRASTEERPAIVMAAPTASLLLMLDHLDLSLARMTLESEMPGRRAELHGQRAVILAELFGRQPPQRVDSSAVPRAVSPLEMRPPSYLRLGHAIRDGRHLQTAGYRVANNDFLDAPASGQEISRFVMGEIEVELSADSLELSRLTLVEIVNLDSSPLPGALAATRSWDIAVDYAPWHRSCANCADFGIRGRLGKAHRATDGLLLYGLAGGRLHTRNAASDGVATLVAELGFVAEWAGGGAVHGVTQLLRDVDSGRQDAVLGLSFALNRMRSPDVRLLLERSNRAGYAALQLSYHFD